MGFPSQTPYMNPIEHFWEHLKKEKIKHNSLNNLQDVINGCWKNIKTEVMKKPIDPYLAELKQC